MEGHEGRRLLSPWVNCGVHGDTPESEGPLCRRGLRRGPSEDFRREDVHSHRLILRSVECPFRSRPVLTEGGLWVVRTEVVSPIESVQRTEVTGRGVVTGPKEEVYGDRHSGGQGSLRDELRTVGVGRVASSTSSTCPETGTSPKPQGGSTDSRRGVVVVYHDSRRRRVRILGPRYSYPDETRGPPSLHTKWVLWVELLAFLRSRLPRSCT